ncbi:unnamed protein product [Orchesella dallaii]|uniref:Terpene synthase n=1 Tax=Orchesella dallaii TaxID=48710 RepID=A0ABP1RR74_9HEXA
MEKKYGRVLFKTPNTNNLIETQSLNSIRFSNLDHKWYDADGKIHPEFENYKGKEFSLYFKIEQHDKNGVLVPFEGNIQLPYRLGELGPQDLDGVAVADMEDQILVRNYKLIDKDENVDQMQATGFLAACFPNQKLEDSKIVRLFNLAAFTFDDEIEKMGTKLYFKELNYFAKSAGEILKGKLVDLEKVNAGSVKLPNTFLKYLQIMQLFQTELSKAEKEQNLNGNYIRETYRKYIEGICQENCIEWNEQKPGIFYNAKKELRTWVAATFVFLEMALFDSKINPNPEVRKTFLFQWFARLYTMQTSLINDLVSFRKEVESTQGVGCNKVYLLHNEKGLPLKDAIQKVLDKTNDITTQLVETGNLLCQLHKGDKHVKRYVEKAKDMVYGHVQWITFSDRYHKNFVFDCVVN